ncbi:hypothetical protein [Bacillus albus]|uniref:hypothetical protein n=1 Tax=Bacillus albus TaxID=2026189 RepID=UPI0037D2D639
MNKTYYCYSKQLKDFLKMNNLRYATTGKHNNGNIYWCFERGEKLDSALGKWNELKALLKQ